MKIYRYILSLTILLITNTSISQELGIQLYSLRNQFKKDVPSTLKLISEWGLANIEGGENTYGMEENEFISLLDQYGLNVVSVGTNLKELSENLQKAIDRAKAFGADYVMCPSIPHHGDTLSFDEISDATSILNQSGKIIQEHGLQLVYHPHGYEFVPHKNGTLFDYMAENALYFDFEMDVYWAVHGGADPISLFEKYPDKFKLLHLKDMKKGVQGNYTGHADKKTNVILGTGKIDMEEIIHRAKKIGVKYMFIEDESSKVLEQIPQSLSYLRSLEP